MHLARLELEEFRSYRRLVLPVDRCGVRLFGANASGKSTLLEAISMLATTRSPRTSTDREVVNWASGQEYGVPPYARSRGEIVRHGGSVIVEVAIEVNGTGEGTAKKQVRLGGRQVRAADAVGTLKAVLFSAEDVDLVGGPPAERRRYLDLAISQLDGRYLRALSRFNRVLAERNSLLKAFARDRVNPTAATVDAQLAFWDEELVAFGSQVIAYRLLTTARLAARASERYAWLSGGRSLSLAYRSTVEPGPTAAAVSAALEEVQAQVARGYTIRLHERRRDEVRRGVTLVGPHRDDLTFTSDGVDLATFGSRGQQRLSIVAVKLAETEVMTEAAGEPPVLLLDDVLSELDPDRRQMLAETIATNEPQILITATDARLLEQGVLAKLPIARVDDGNVVLGGPGTDAGRSSAP